MTTLPRLPAAEKFITQMRDMFAVTPDLSVRWERARHLLAEMLGDAEIRKHAQTWPDSPAILGLEGKHGNLLLYEDPDWGFCVNALIKKPTAKTTIHDHGVSWTLYGVVEGGEDVARFERIDGGTPGDLPKSAVVRETESIPVQPGYIDLIKPWEIHAEYNRPERTAAIIIRSQKCGTYIQNIFYQKDSTVEQYWGPQQIPFHFGWEPKSPDHVS
jgi:predicted metal-dependent enzyme (double-stranded beta helix superfamily)